MSRIVSWLRVCVEYGSYRPIRGSDIFGATMEKSDGMKIFIVGAGAVGGYLGATLAHAGHDVSVIARGAHLEAIRRNGLKLIRSDGSGGSIPNLPAPRRLRHA